MDLPRTKRDLLERYGLALGLAGLALLVRAMLPVPQGTTIYELPLAAVVLSALYGGRGPGLFASLICITGSSYWFVPPVNSFAISPDHVLPFSIFTALCLLLTEFSAGRRRVEHARRESEERFRALVQFSFDVYWETDVQHRFIRQDISERAPEGPLPGSEIGKTRWELPYLEIDEEAWRKHREMLDAHLPFRDLEYARPTPGGGKRYAAVSGLPMFDETGRFVGYRGVARHITERKRAEAEHRVHVRFLESLDRINRAVQATQDLEKMMGDVLDAVLEIFASDRAWLVYPCDPQSASWHVVMCRTRPQFDGAPPVQSDMPTEAGVAAAFAAALANRGCVTLVPELVAERVEVRSRLAMALYPKGDAPYLFGLHQCSRERVWTADEQRLFEEIGHRLTDALASLIAFRSLQESEHKLEAAQRIAHVGWWERDYAAGRWLTSDEVRRIYGIAGMDPVMDLAEWMKVVPSIIHPEDQLRVLEASEASLRGGPRYDIEYRIVHADGTVRVVHAQADVMLDESGRPVRQFGVAQDITELRRAEQEVRARQDMLDLAQKAAHAVAFDWCIGARESENRWSPELEAMYGLEPGTFGRTYEAWKELVHPDDWPSVKRAIERANQSGDVDAEYRVVHKDGAVRWLQAKGRMFFDAGRRPERMVGFMTDVTDRRQAEEEFRATEARFRTFVDHATDAFFLLDEQVIVVDVNRQACAGLGYSRDELIGLHPRDFDVGLDEGSIAQLGARVGAGETVTFETVHRRKDGVVFPVEIRARAFQQGEQQFILSLSRDISERKRAEEQLRASEERFRTLVQFSFDVYWETDAQHRFTRQEFMEGLADAPEPGSEIGKTRWEVPYLEPDEEAWGKHRATLDAHLPFRDFEVARPASDGGKRYVSTSGLPMFDETGRFIGYRGVGRHITERKRAEQELQRLHLQLVHMNRVMTTAELATSIAHEVNQPLGSILASVGPCLRWLNAQPPDLASTSRALERIATEAERASQVISRIRALVKREPPRHERINVNQVISEVIALTRDQMHSHDVALQSELAADLMVVHGDRVQLQQVILNLIANAIEAMSTIRDRRRQLAILSANDGTGVRVEVRDCGPGVDPDGAERIFEPFYTTKADGIGMGLWICRSIIEAHGGRLWVTPNPPRGAAFQFSLPGRKLKAEWATRQGRQRRHSSRSEGRADQ